MYWIVQCVASNSTGGPGITRTSLESISTGFSFTSASALHFPPTKRLNPDVSPDTSGTVRGCVYLRRRRRKRVASVAMRMKPNVAPTPMPAFALLLKLPPLEPVDAGFTGWGVEVADDIEGIAVGMVEVTPMRDARDAAYALGKRLRSLLSQETVRGAAILVPEVTTVVL
jgi:hypothetical protein